MEPWYKVATPRKEVREGRSFNPDEFAIHLEQVIAETAPEDYREPKQFFARTCFTRALREHAGMVLRRLSGETANTAPVMTLITQFGGGKTHTLTALYHLATNGAKAAEYSGVANLISRGRHQDRAQGQGRRLRRQRLGPARGTRDAMDRCGPAACRRQRRRELGPAAKTTPPGTEALSRVFKAAGGPVLLLFDEVLNFLNRHRGMADQFHAFIQNLTVATTGTTHGARDHQPAAQPGRDDRLGHAVAGQDHEGRAPRGQGPDRQRRERDQRGGPPAACSRTSAAERIRKSVSKSYARLVLRAASATSAGVDGGGSAADGGEGAGVPARPVRGLLSVPPGHALGVPAQVAGAAAVSADARHARDAGAVDFAGPTATAFTKARREPLITLGSAPLDVPEFRSVVLGQLGESRLGAAIDTDIAGKQSHARALDADTRAPQGHPPAGGDRDPVRVVGRTDRQAGAPAGAAVRARRARSGHDVGRQRRACA